MLRMLGFATLVAVAVACAIVAVQGVLAVWRGGLDNDPDDGPPGGGGDGGGDVSGWGTG